MFDFLRLRKAEINELDACAHTDNVATDAVYMANHYIYTEFEHPGYALKIVENVADNKYKITLSDGYCFTVTQENADDITIAIADEFNRYYREDVCHLYENLDKVRN